MNDTVKKNGQIQRLDAATRDQGVPLSYSQERLWVIDRLYPGLTAYNMCGVIRIEGDLAVDVLERSLAEVVRRHEVLRTRLGYRDGVPVQIIEPVEKVGLEKVDLAQLGSEEREARLRDLRAAEEQHQFDLTKGPLTRMKLVKLRAREHLLLLTLHHIIFDGWSAGVLGREFVLLYSAFGRGARSPLPELRVQYADYAVWQREWLQGNVLERQLSYWRKQLTGIKALALPTDRARGEVPSHRGSWRAAHVSQKLAAELEALSRKEGVTLFMLLLAAFKVLLWEYSGQEDIVVGCPIANRNHSELLGLIGFFVNTLVLRTNLSGNPTFRELLTREKEVALEAYEHQDLPFERVVEELQPKRELGRNPLFQVMFALQNAPAPAINVSGLKFEQQGAMQGAAKFDLLFSLETAPEGLRGGFEYSVELFDDATIERMAEHWAKLVRKIAENPEQRLSELAVLNDEERERLAARRQRLEKEYSRQRAAEEERSTMAATTQAWTSVYNTVNQVWEEILEQQNLLADQTFFELGGNSIKLLLMLFEINKRLNQSLLITDIFDHLTIERLSRLLTDLLTGKAVNDTDHLITLKDAKAGKSAFLMHAVGGDLAPYDRLVNSISAPLNIHGLAYRGLYGTRDPVNDLDAILATYTDKVLASLSDDPFIIGGWSFGGLIALSVAERCQKHGRKPDFVFLIDSYLPPTLESAERTEAELFIEYLFSVSARPDDLARLLKEPVLSFSALVGLARDEGWIDAAIRIEDVRRFLTIYRANRALLASYRLPEFSGRTVYFRAQERFVSRWRNLDADPALQMEIVDIPGHHFSLLSEPNVQFIAQAMDRLLTGDAECSLRLTQEAEVLRLA